MPCLSDEAGERLASRPNRRSVVLDVDPFTLPRATSNLGLDNGKRGDFRERRPRGQR